MNYGFNNNPITPKRSLMRLLNIHLLEVLKQHDSMMSSKNLNQDIACCCCKTNFRAGIHNAGIAPLQRPYTHKYTTSEHTHAGQHTPHP